MTSTRINPYGIMFRITPSGTKTMVNSGSKSLLIDLPFEEFMQCWYNWQMKGFSIQDAFRLVPSEQREFLMTTITPEEWKEIFEGKRDVED